LEKLGGVAPFIIASKIFFGLKFLQKLLKIPGTGNIGGGGSGGVKMAFLKIIHLFTTYCKISARLKRFCSKYFLSLNLKKFSQKSQFLG